MKNIFTFLILIALFAVVDLIFYGQIKWEQNILVALLSIVLTNIAICNSHNFYILFFGLLLTTMTFVILSLFIGFKLPTYFFFWWVLLLPIVILKMFFPKSKITQWLVKERW